MDHPSFLRVSSPGKVFLCGGYIVLRGGSAFVISTSSRFYSEISMVQDKSNTFDIINITVESPQFKRVYNYTLSHQNEEIILSSSKDNDNPYILYSLIYSLSYLCFKDKILGLSRHISSLNIKIMADNDFYSHSTILRSKSILPTREVLSSLEKFSSIYYGDQRVAKTGLGSSATLVTSLVASILVWGLNLTSNVPESEFNMKNHLNLIHNIAQISHCNAQGKVGSGFDVSSAIYGSQIYKQFDKSIIENELNSISSIEKDNSTLIYPITNSFMKEFVQKVSLSWNSQVKNIRLPKGMVLTLCETGKDMNTPLSVRKVLDWANNEKEKANHLFNEINKLNEIIIDTFFEILDLQESYKEYDQYRNHYATLTSKEILELNESSDQYLLPRLKLIIQTFGCVRNYLKELTERTQTPIEPQEISDILDEMMNIKGVIMAGAPGAGGYDAIYSILLDESCYSNLENMWLKYESLNVSPLLTREDNRGVSIEDYHNE